MTTTMIRFRLEKVITLAVLWKKLLEEGKRELGPVIMIQRSNSGFHWGGLQ